jgi:competence protein ComEA
VADPGRRGLVVLALLAFAAALGGAWYFVAAQPRSLSGVGGPSAGPAAAAAVGSPGAGAAPVFSGWPTTGASSAPARIEVDVVGAVVAPGVVELPAGARVKDAVDAAGGALPGTDLTALNLAARLADGAQVFVGVAPPSGAAAVAAGGVVGGTSGTGVGAGGDGASGAPPTLDLNTASVAELEALPGIGPVLAQNIVQWRSAHGRFTAVGQLQQVSGIGPSKFAELAPRVRV